MKTLKASNPPSRPRIPLEQRIVSGTIIGPVGPDYCNLKLADGRSGRLRKEHTDSALQGRWDRLQEGDHIAVFLLNSTERDPKLWNLNQRWVDEAVNPWFRQCPEEGDDVCGRVMRYVADYAAIVALEDTGIEALLHRARVPGVGYRHIAETLYVGDRVCGRVVRVDTGLLDVDIDLRPVIDDQRAAARAEAEARKRAARESGGATSPPRASHTEPVLEGICLWVVDNDRGFRSALEAWLKLLGAEVETFRSCGALAARLRSGHRPTHLLLDLNLDGGSDEWNECERLTSTLGKEIQIAACSGDDGLLRACRYPGFRKPVDAAALLAWLSQGTAPAPLQETLGPNREDLWLTQALELDFQREAADMLAEVCRDLGLEAALWAERTRPGFFEPLAWYGLEAREIHETQPFFGQTLIAGVIERETEEEHDRLGPLKGLVPAACTSAFGLPLQDLGAPDHALILFSRRKLSKETKGTLRTLGRGFAALIARRETIRALDEERPFAALGRFSSGYAHEIKQVVAPALLAARSFRSRLSSQADTNQETTPTVQEVRRQARTLLDQLEQLEKTASYELGRIRRRSAQRLRVIETVRRVVDLADAELCQESQRRANKDPNYKGPSLWLDQAPATEIEIALDAQALEQPLLNLLNNALYQVESLGDSGIVKVSIEIHPEDADGLPLRIEVRDNGPGIDAGQQPRLFRPRTSTRGPEGIGLGLYISERLVHGAGGRLELIETTRFLGTRFRMRFPVGISDWEATRG